MYAFHNEVMYYIMLNECYILSTMQALLRIEYVPVLDSQTARVSGRVEWISCQNVSPLPSADQLNTLSQETLLLA